ncbi:MAG: EAL domain-containing protein [Sulfuricella sp.]|nr:EAL domain-containing protein [Sulfuricella sp.]
MHTASGLARPGYRGMLVKDAERPDFAADECMLEYARHAGNLNHDIGERLRLRYQPQIDMRNGRIVGAEALPHWTRPELEPPSRGAIAALGGGISPEYSVAEWAVREACLNIRAIDRAGLPALRTTLRLSARQVTDPRLPGCLRESLAEAGAQPGQIEFGISESTLLGKDPAVASALRKLADTGAGIAIRDFGSAHSELSYPISFPVNAIWIDCPFFWRFARGADAAEIVSAILSLAEKLKLSVVAWGVECANQMMLLYDEGCNVMQGSLLCRPLQINPFTALMKQLGNAQPTVTGGVMHA